MWAIRAASKGCGEAEPWLEFLLLRPDPVGGPPVPGCRGRSLRSHLLDPEMFRHPAFLVLCDLMRMDPKGRPGWD